MNNRRTLDLFTRDKLRIIPWCYEKVDLLAIFFIFLNFAQRKRDDKREETGVMGSWREQKPNKGKQWIQIKIKAKWMSLRLFWDLLSPFKLHCHNFLFCTKIQDTKGWERKEADGKKERQREISEGQRRDQRRSLKLEKKKVCKRKWNGSLKWYANWKEENKSCKGSDNDVTKARATNSKP